MKKEKEITKEESDILGKYNFTFDEAIRQEDGTWKVTRTIKQGITTDFKVMFIREFSVMGMDKTFEKAQTPSLNTIRSLLQEYDGNLFSKEEWPHKQYSVELDPPKGKQNVLSEDDKDTES